MRFKKLRIAVGAMMIIFIFVVGNIIAFGKLMSSPAVKIVNTNRNDIIDPKSVSSQLPSNPDPQPQKAVNTQPQQQQPTQKVEYTPPPPQPQPRPIYTFRRTRAS